MPWCVVIHIDQHTNHSFALTRSTASTPDSYCHWTYTETHSHHSPLSPPAHPTPSHYSYCKCRNLPNADSAPAASTSDEVSPYNLLLLSLLRLNGRRRLRLRPYPFWNSWLSSPGCRARAWIFGWRSRSYRIGWASRLDGLFIRFGRRRARVCLVLCGCWRGRSSLFRVSRLWASRTECFGNFVAIALL